MPVEVRPSDDLLELAACRGCGVVFCAWRSAAVHEATCPVEAERMAPRSPVDEGATP